MMEWVVGLIAVIAIPVWILVWWIPFCDKVGIEKARIREAKEQEAKERE